ncbi:hypothetical protein [Flavobacterium degerlachei]|uniref:Uncharacterized protein n=1 Tax=Flavobacterium degerlachei TaxID=229203 RepID=A0A1H3EBV3_9FLAO|nr:hypothetical protein [Flavobacterium degerlachei]SDX75394.1 hypothetical protein SAMN05444338_11484 [Flavobacterium degerlachei]
MKAKEVAKLLEWIKYLTLRKFTVKFSVDANVEKIEAIEEKYIQLSGNHSFNIKSIVNDYGNDYSESKEKKEIKIYFGKHPEIGDVIGTGPDRKYEIVIDPEGLMTPAIIQDYVEDSESFKRYIFPSNQDNTYSQEFTTYNDWHSTINNIDIDQNYSRSRSMTILVEASSYDSFNSFLNESYSDWESRFITARELAKAENFDWFNLYDPKIYKYALSFEDRKIILDKLVTTTNWYLTFDFLSDKYELFISLIDNTSKDDGAALYNYMFATDTSTISTGKTNLQVYKDKLPTKLYDELIRTLMNFFYSTKTVVQFKDSLTVSQFYPIGLEMLGPWTIPLKTYYDLDAEYENGTGYFTRGVKYVIETINGSNLKIKIKSAIQYRYNPYLTRVEYKVFNSIGHDEEWNFDDILFVSPYLANEEIKGLNIPHGSIIPIPAFALPWLVDRNESTEDIFDLIEKAVTFAGVVFPIIKIIEGVSVLSVIYNAIGMGFTLTGNTLGAGLADQIQRFDAHQSNILGHPYTKGQDFLDIYYLISAIYGGINLGTAIGKANGIKEKIKVFGEFETLWGIRGTIIDFNAFMEEQPDENLDSLNIIKNEMNLLDTDISRFQFYKEKK